MGSGILLLPLWHVNLFPGLVFPEEFNMFWLARKRLFLYSFVFQSLVCAAGVWITMLIPSDGIAVIHLTNQAPCSR